MGKINDVLQEVGARWENYRKASRLPVLGPAPGVAFFTCMFTPSDKLRREEVSDQEETGEESP